MTRMTGMKVVTICCALSLMAGSAYAALAKDEVKRLASSARVISELRDAPDRSIPEDLWNKAQCVIVVPSMKRAAFIVGGEYGAGVMSCRRGTGWSAPVFLTLEKGSWGLQIGAAEVDLVLLAMSQHGANKLLESKVSLGADASVAAGPVGRSGQAATDVTMNADLLSYSRAHGVFAGIDLSGGVVHTDQNANARAYGHNVDAKAVVEGRTRVSAPPAAGSFLAALSRDLRITRARK